MIWLYVGLAFYGLGLIGTLAWTGWNFGARGGLPELPAHELVNCLCWPITAPVALGWTAQQLHQKNSKNANKNKQKA